MAVATTSSTTSLTPDAAAAARDWFGAFRRSFPDMEMKLEQLVAEGDTVVGRSGSCSATHLGDWRGHAPTGRRFEAVAEVYFFTFADERIASFWGVGRHARPLQPTSTRPGVFIAPSIACR